MKKILIGGILAGLVILVIGLIFGSLTANMYRMSPQIMWKPMGQNFFVQVIIYDLIVGIILAYVYSILKNSVPGSGIVKGLIFGLLVWLVGSVPGLGITYLTMNIRNKLIFTWLVNNLINYCLAGAVIQQIDEKVK